VVCGCIGGATGFLGGEGLQVVATEQRAPPSPLTMERLRRCSGNSNS
jgi:hypothetical protein